MTNGICPKCSATQIYRFAALGQQQDIRIDFWTRLPVSHFLCTQCGYLEQYVLDANVLDEARTQAQYVAPQQA